MLNAQRNVQEKRRTLLDLNDMVLHKSILAGKVTGLSHLPQDGNNYGGILENGTSRVSMHRIRMKKSFRKKLE